MSIMKQDPESLENNKKQTSSFGNWYAVPYDRLYIIVLSDQIMSDKAASQMMNDLISEISSTFPTLSTNPSCEIERQRMERIIRNLCETYGSSDDKIYKAKQSIHDTTNVMRGNINSMLQNSNKLDDIEGAATDLRSAAHMFSDRGRLLELKMKRRNRMLMIALAAI